MFTLLKFSSGNSPKYLLIKSSLVMNCSPFFWCDAYFWKTSRNFSVVARLISVGPWRKKHAGKKNQNSKLVSEWISDATLQICIHFLAAVSHFKWFVYLFIYRIANTTTGFLSEFSIILFSQQFCYRAFVLYNFLWRWERKKCDDVNFILKTCSSRCRCHRYIENHIQTFN